MRSVTMALLLLVLAACSGTDPKATAITPELLEDQEKIAAIANRLEPEERALFGGYVASRAFIASGFGRPVVNAAGDDPATVGEAIDLMREIEARNERIQALAAERDVALAPLLEDLEVLADASEAAGWAPREVEAHNAMVERINAIRDDYQSRIDALVTE